MRSAHNQLTLKRPARPWIGALRSPRPERSRASEGRGYCPRARIGYAKAESVANRGAIWLFPPNYRAPKRPPSYPHHTTISYLTRQNFESISQEFIGKWDKATARTGRAINRDQKAHAEHRGTIHPSDLRDRTFQRRMGCNRNLSRPPYVGRDEQAPPIVLRWAMFNDELCPAVRVRIKFEASQLTLLRPKTADLELAPWRGIHANINSDFPR
ncbi:hypothetical protein ABMB68_000998 [Bradyrhizobium sp. RT4a]